MRIKMCIVVMMIGLASVFAQAPHVDDAVVKYFAEYMNVNDSLLYIPELYATINEWMGTPYHYGRSDRKGTDCSGFVRSIFRPLCGEELPRSASGMSKVIQPRPVSELKEGDLVFFNNRGRINSHVGIYLQNGWFVHASTVNGVTLNNLHTSYYTRHFSKGGSLKQGELKELILQTRGSHEELTLLEPLIPIGIRHIEPSAQH
ncbi:MAG: C40 family peptidase [Bacteroidales bacterium]|nr:C40 family peptidase [Bacteroidales bacterium]